MKYLIDDIWDEIRSHDEIEGDVLLLRHDRLNTVLHEFEELFEAPGELSDLENYFGFDIVISKDIETEFSIR